MRALVWLVCVLLLAALWSPPDATAISRKKECRLGCGGAVDACVMAGGKRRRCKRQTLKRCRKQGIETCTVTTTTGPPTTGVTTTTTPGTTTTTLPMTNGCTTASAVVRTAPTADRTVEFGEYFYSPQCIRIGAGQSVTFMASLGGTFLSHPLFAGEIVGDAQVPDPTSPIPTTADGDLLDVVFPNPGTFPYYCGVHGVSNRMFGVVFVDPPPS